VSPVKSLLEIPTDVGDGTVTGTDMAQLARIASDTPDTVMVFAPLTAVTLPPQALIALPEIVIGDGNVKTKPTADAVVSVCVFETNKSNVDELLATDEANDASTMTAWKFVSVYKDLIYSPGVDPMVN
jgi:hypothetical protein